MNEKTKTKQLITIIIFLLASNIAMLIFFLVLSKPVERRPRNHELNGLYKSLQNDVGFSTDQLNKYEGLRKDQMTKAHPMFNELRDAKRNFYELIYNTAASDSTINADADSIAQKQRKLDMQMFRYFKNVRNICTPGQIQKFDSVINKVVLRMVGRQGKNKERQRK